MFLFTCSMVTWENQTYPELNQSFPAFLGLRSSQVWQGLKSSCSSTKPICFSVCKCNRWTDVMTRGDSDLGPWSVDGPTLLGVGAAVGPPEQARAHSSSRSISADLALSECNSIRRSPTTLHSSISPSGCHGMSILCNFHLISAIGCSGNQSRNGFWLRIGTLGPENTLRLHSFYIVIFKSPTLSHLALG